MTGTVAQIWRHPIKGVGTETLDRVALRPGRPLPMDRAWAVLDAQGEPGDGWRACRNFVRGAKAPALMAVTARVTGTEADASLRLHLAHPDRPGLAIDPRSAGDATALIGWLDPLVPGDRPRPHKLVPSPPEGMSDAPYPSISLLGLSSLRALSDRLGQPLDPRRFRGNLWVDGLGPWEEFEWVGRTLAIGDAKLEIVERIGRCRATEANPDTGRRDAATLRALEDGWEHTDFGVYARVVSEGTVAVGDGVRAS